MLREKSYLNQLERSKTMPVKLHAETKVAHNYSTQNLNSTEQALDKSREILGLVRRTSLSHWTTRFILCYVLQQPEVRFTYAPDYHHSGTLPPGTRAAVLQEARERDKLKRSSPFDWTYPGKKTFLESNRHPLAPPAYRVAELKKVRCPLHSCVLLLPCQLCAYVCCRSGSRTRTTPTCATSSNETTSSGASAVAIWTSGTDRVQRSGSELAS